MQKLHGDFNAPGDQPTRPHGNCYWLLAGRLLAGEHPGAPGAAQLADRLAALLDAGVSQFIDLTREDESLPDYAPLLQEMGASRRIEVAHTRFPIKDYSTPDRALTRRILTCMDRALADGGVTYLHCHGGAGRTGTVVGCWLVEQGLAPDAALDLIAAKWQLMEKRQRIEHSPETQAQRDWVKGWPQKRLSVEP